MRILVTAGPTREAIDPVRFISNRSSGKMGYAVAVAARDRGHEVRLVSGPVALQPPYGVSTVQVVTAAEMLSAVEASVDWCDALVMSAAVADWRPAAVLPQKIKKMNQLAELRLEATVDILSAVRPRKGTRTFVGFAAETETVLAEARRKAHAKGLDAIVANDVSRPEAGFDVDTNRAILVAEDGTTLDLPLMSKADMAVRIVTWIETRRGVTGAPGPVPAVTGDVPAVGERLSKQLAFVREIDRLKCVFRRTLLMDGSRYENDAEHSWHLAIMAVLLREYANDPAVDIGHVIELALVHDLVEIDAGDTYCYDDAGHLDKAARERAAADRLFSLLPEDQKRSIRSLWEEFEARETSEARFAAALDRVQPMMHNYATGGKIWKKNGVRSGQVRDRNRHVADGSRVLWDYADALIRDAVKCGMLDP